MLLEKIKKDQVNARKAKDVNKAKSLTTLYSEAANIGLNDGKRESTDDEVMAVIKKFVKGIDETMSHFNGYPEDLSAEKALLMSYMPSQLDGDAILSIVQNQIDEMGEVSIKDMGKIMGFLKSNYNGQFDGRLASSIIKKELSDV